MDTGSQSEGEVEAQSHTHHNLRASPSRSSSSQHSPKPSPGPGPSQTRLNPKPTKGFPFAAPHMGAGRGLNGGSKMTGVPRHQAHITKPVHKYRPARAVQSTTPTGSNQAVQGSFSIQSTHMESVMAVEGNIKSLTSDVEGLRQDLGTVQHSVGRLETGQACGNSLMICMLEGMGWSQEQIQQRVVQVGMIHSSSAPNLQGLPASQAPKTEGVQAPLSTPTKRDAAKREDNGEEAKHMDCHKGSRAGGPAQDTPQGGRLPDMPLDHAV